MTLHTAAWFDQLFEADHDPWHFASRWYEERKRALTLAALPARRYASGYEPGCANGELSAALAARCDHLLVSDGSAQAVALARQRLALLPNVDVHQAWVPKQWPDMKFDLIVLSEFLYYLTPADLDALAGKVSASLTAGGTVLACHWRRHIEGCEWDGDTVNARLHAALGLHHLSTSVDADLLLNVWCTTGTSVAQRDGLAPAAEAVWSAPSHPPSNAPSFAFKTST